MMNDLMVVVWSRNEVSRSILTYYEFINGGRVDLGEGVFRALMLVKDFYELK